MTNSYVRTRSASIRRPSPEAGTREATGAQTLLRGLGVLEAVAEGPLGLTELARRLGLSKSTTHRLASTLVERRYLAFRPREGYHLGPKLLELGYCAREQVHLVRIARPHLEALARESEDVVHLGVLSSRQVLYLDKVEGRRRIEVRSRIGECQPISTTSLGKALILDRGEDAWRLVYEAEQGGAPSGLLLWLERMRSYATAGHAFDLEENEAEVRCIAAPIRDGEGAVLAAVSITSTRQYLSEARMRELAGSVRRTAAAISRELGHVPRRDPAGDD